ncbi:MAG: GNAT family N-acetyltransferase [Gemmatimonadales bacterium]
MTTDIRVRVGSPSEKERLEELQRRASLENAGDRASLLAHPDAIEVPREQLESGSVVVAESEGVVVGFAAVVRRDDGDAELDALFVEPGLWKRGIGRHLVTHCAILAESRGAASLHVVGNPHAQGFYTACGFEMVGTTTTRFGSGILMRLAVK